MNKLNYYIILLITLLPSIQSRCDVFFINDSIPNFYTKVTDVYTADPATIDSVRVSNTGLFSKDDLALLIQMKGAEIDLVTQTITNIHNSGKYEILKISDVDDFNGLITFSSDLINAYDPQQAVQLIHIPTHYNATIEKEITCEKWDGQTGGVLVLFAENKLILDADINVSGKGFRGADPAGDVYNGDCSSVDSAGYSRLYYTSSAIDSAGKKGEGIINTGFQYTRGMGSAINGGGGGNGMLAGGYGGGNYNYGGSGGDEYITCNTIYNKPQSAKIPSGYYTNNAPHKNRVFLGGGGGCGTQTVDGSATKGGDGGGIVILITDSLVTNNYNIISNGQNVTDTANNFGGAGGGGAGGSIVLDAKSIIGQLNIEAKGGNGGYTKGSNCTGPGSGGGGGLFWFSGTLPSDISSNILLDGGRQGRTSDCGSHGTTTGSKGDTMNNLIPPLNGFLYNYIKEKVKVICQGDIPTSFTGTTPKGGDGTYSFIWQHKNSCCDWQPATEGTYLQKDLVFNNPLSDTLQYRRIVTSGGYNDTSEIVQINVIPSIQHNIIINDQTICFGNKADTLKQGITPLDGGTGTYMYQWEYSENGSLWDTVNESGDQSFYMPGAPMDTIFYRRKVTSGVCNDISDTITINVLPVISNNTISDKQYVCGPGQPDTITGSNPAGGDGGTYSYMWMKTTDTSMNWDTVFGQDKQSLYLPGIISDTNYYKRIVYSGTNNACIDTTNIHAANVIPPLEDNVLAVYADTVCKHATCDTIMASVPQKGGGMSTYQYEWIKSYNGIDWETTACTTRYYPPEMISEPVLFKRVVHSYTCHDTSNNMSFYLYPSPNAVLGSMDTSICSGDSIELSIGLSGQYSPWYIVYSGGYGIFDSVKNIYNDTAVIITPETTDSNTRFRYKITTITNRLGCSTSDTNNIEGTAVVNTFGWPTPNAGPDMEFCDTTGVLNAIQSFGNTHWQSLNGNDPVLFEQPDNPDTRVNVNITNEETFRFLLQETNWQCQRQDTINVTFYFPPQPDAGEDIVLMFKRDTVLNADSLGQNETAFWNIIKGSGFIVNDSSLSTEIQDLSYDETNYITWNVKKGVCDLASDTIKITILDMEIPTGFSPNNDGINDQFVIKGLNLSDQNELIVFNKWGRVIYSSNNYQNNWGGYNQQNKELVEDTYFYVLKVKGEISSEKSGFIVIKR